MKSKRDEIIDFAMVLIRKKGFSAFSYDDISKELKITKAAVHYHFEKKEDLGIAICDALQQGLVKCYEKSLLDNDFHPWNFIESRITRIESSAICPISSLQSDYDSLPDSMKEKLKMISKSEFDLFLSLIKKYVPDFNDETSAITAITSVKGLLQYRRIMGEEFYLNTIKHIKDQFYKTLENKEVK